MVKISVVINTLNEEKNIERAIYSVKWANEIVVCDMYSDDKTVELAKKLGAKVAYHKKTNYVEPARNFAISKSTGDWILVLDADEEIPESLAKRLQQIADKMHQIDYVEIPRKNIIFDKWMKASMWWPDYNIRFFKKGKVTWSDKIHIPPQTQGAGIKLEVKEEWAIIHYNYNNISQYLERMNRYSTIQAKELIKDGYKFKWQDLVQKPMSEFLGRYFANRGFEYGLHGLALAIMQAFSFLIVYLKVWEMEKFESREINFDDVKKLTQSEGEQISYWLKYSNLSPNPFKRVIQKIKNRLS